jgi:hypothetical protein
MVMKSKMALFLVLVLSTAAMARPPARLGALVKAAKFAATGEASASAFVVKAHN